MKDFFVSYNSADREWAEWVAWHLEEAGNEVVIQAWDFRPGSNFVLEMDKATKEAKRTIAVLSPSYLDALYTHPEWAAAFAQDPTGEKGTLLPVRVQDFDLKGLLAPILYIDLVGLDEKVAKQTLLDGIPHERAKPTSAPCFPGTKVRAAVKSHTVNKPERFPGEPPTLRLLLTGEGEDKYRVDVELEDGEQTQRATAKFGFKFTAQEQEDLRWYLEDFLQYPLAPAPEVAARIEARMAEVGVELFRALFHANDDTRELWIKLRGRLNGARVEIVTEVQGAAAIPWELLRAPNTDTPLALSARAFVRTHQQAVKHQEPVQTESGTIRILLVICRPGGRSDVPFRSVAIPLIKGLGEREREAFQLDVLRPPTFEQLGRVLRNAKSDGQPYHVVHFDGHGVYIKSSEKGSLANILQGLSALVLDGARSGQHGYLLFENPALDENMQLVGGTPLGQLLFDADVSALVLNACRSAHAEPPTKPEDAKADLHAQVRAFGSLAQEVIDAGVPGVVAMRYNVYVVTAAQFVFDLYASLAQGRTLGEAVTLGRKQLHAQPLRTIAYEPIALQDWAVPVIYETAPIALFPQTQTTEEFTISIEAGESAPARGDIDQKLPPHPDAGFFGRDETLLALDRAFDTQNIVLLHAYAGSGKTATAAEFARWYALTGGVEGPVLFTSFEQHKPLARVLADFERVFGGWLESQGVRFLALDEALRRNVALQVLERIPVLWIWDNVEPVAGFPAGTDSAWSADEQLELANFLRATRETKAKFLLTSRRDERGWLGDLPARITMPSMPMQERVQLARALAEKHGRRLADVDDWRPLLQFTRGNPLTITVLVGQALRDGLRTKEQIKSFVAQLRAGEAKFEDEASEGRTKSLGASLSYGFEHAFTETERKQLALLHFFQGFVDVDVLRVMGDDPTIMQEQGDWHLPELRGLTSEAGIALLDRAAEIGLLTAHGGGYYSIHPALPWYFKSLFEQYYEATKKEAARAFVEAMGTLGNHYWWEYQGGNRDVITALTAEEANLLHARQLARTNGWWRCVISTMQGLDQLYAHTGRRAEWAQLVEEIVPDFVDPDTDVPLPGLEEEWSLVTEYRVRLAEEERQWEEAERLQRIRVDWNRQRAASALALPPEALDGAQRNVIRSLAVSLHELGEIQRELGEPERVTAYEESLALSEQIGEQALAAICAFNLGHAYKDLPALRDLAQAERWYHRSLELREERDRQGQARCLGQLGNVSYERLLDARDAKQPKEELLRHLNAAVQFYQQALDLLPTNAVDDLAVTHNQLGLIYKDAGNLDRALTHYREAIRYFEAAGNIYGAARTRFNVALALRDAGRLPDALDYAQAALRNFQTFGDRAAEMIQKTQRVIALIEQEMGGGD